MSIRKIFALLLLSSLTLNLTGCPVMMAARVAKAASDKSSSDSDTKKDTQNAGAAVSGSQTQTQATTPSK